MIYAGTRVIVWRTPTGLRSSLPAANWIEKETEVVLLEEAPFIDSLDVIDVELDNGDIESIYDFNIKETVL